MSILDNFLKKRGITIDKLSPEEKETFETWRKVLSKDKLSLEDISEFCQTQIDIIENKWKSYETDTDKKAQLIPYYTVYRTLEQIIKSPKVAREQLEAQLNQLL